MRRTASAANFSDYEVATVYDPRMLDHHFGRRASTTWIDRSCFPGLLVWRAARENVGPRRQLYPLYKWEWAQVRFRRCTAPIGGKSGKISGAAESVSFLSPDRRAYGQ